jgi:hypothetical protein
MLDFAGAETDGVRLPIEPPIREIRPDEEPTLEVRPELAAGCLTPVGVEGLLVPIEPVPVEREIRPALERLLEGAAGCLAVVETDGLSILIELPMRDLEPEAGRSILIDRLDEGTDGVLVLMEPPMRDLELVIDRLSDEDEEGALVLMEPPIRDLLLGLIRVPELLVMDVPDEGLRRLEELEGLETVIRLGLLLVDIVPERVGVDRLTDILPELLRLGIELERLGIDRVTDILLELPLRLGTDRLGDIERDRLGVGARLIDDLLELLRLGIDRLMDGRLEVIVLDLLELLRLGVLARAGGADLATDVFALELRELELFLELLPAKTGSTARANSKMKKINRKLKPCSERSRRLGNRILSL